MLSRGAELEITISTRFLDSLVPDHPSKKVESKAPEQARKEETATAQTEQKPKPRQFFWNKYKAPDPYQKVSFLHAKSLNFTLGHGGSTQAEARIRHWNQQSARATGADGPHVGRVKDAVRAVNIRQI